MQLFRLPRHLARAAQSASRLLGAKPPNSDETRRRDAVARWRRAMGQGLSSAQSACAVGVSRATLYRWEERAEPRSRRPRRVRRPTWASALVEAVERLRAANPMWAELARGHAKRSLVGWTAEGKRKIAVLLRREGFTVSTSMVGRILRRLMDRGVVIPVPTLRRNPAARRVRLMAKQRHAKRLPKGLKPTKPGEIVQIDTLSVNIRPDRAIKHFTAYDPVAKWTVGRVATSASALSAKALLEKLCAEAPFPVTGIQVDGGSEFMADFENACAARNLTLFVLPPKRPQLNGAVERNQGAW